MIIANNKIRIAAIIPAYHPDTEIISNISSYIDHIEKVYIYCNSVLDDELSRSLIFKYSNKIQFLGDGSNIGVAAAYNICIEDARKMHFSHALTMDQDSSFIKFPSLDKLEDCSLLYPLCQLNGAYIATQNPPWIMNSGCIVSIPAWEEMGGYDETLFVDAVDFEFAMRALYSDKAILSGEGILNHNLGVSLKHIKICWLKVRVTNHADYRVRWFCRNYINISKSWLTKKPKWALFLLYVVALRLFKILLFEDKKVSKLIAGIKGIQEGLYSRRITNKQHNGKILK